MLVVVGVQSQFQTSAQVPVLLVLRKNPFVERVDDPKHFASAATAGHKTGLEFSSRPSRVLP